MAERKRGSFETWAEQRRVRAWLKGSTAGRAMLERLTSEELEERCRVCQSEFRPLPRVLVVVRRLGALPGVEVFREPGVSIKVHELVDTRDDPVIECLAEELLVDQLPRYWRHLPECRSESMAFSGLSAGEIRRANETLRILRELEAWAEKLPKAEVPGWQSLARELYPPELLREWRERNQRQVKGIQAAAQAAGGEET